MTTTDEALAELEGIAADRERLDARRDELIRELMDPERKPKVARERIAKAADVSVPRLYQVRDGRR